MTWDRLFKSQNYDQPIYKHTDLPLYKTKTFDFYRCVAFNESFYYKTVSKLHAGNLRETSGRYSQLFQGHKLSYWADSPKTARAEVKQYNHTNNLLTFWAYDDTSSFIPTVDDLEYLSIIDGRQCGIQNLIDKLDNNETVTEQDKKLISDILACEPDCLAYDSHAISGGENFIFLEKGFRKLSLRQVRLRLGDKSAKNKNSICCADTCDYTPYLDGYGYYFAPIAKVKMDKDYLQSEEYKFRSTNRIKNYQNRG